MNVTPSHPHSPFSQANRSSKLGSNLLQHLHSCHSSRSQPHARRVLSISSMAPASKTWLLFLITWCILAHVVVVVHSNIVDNSTITWPLQTVVFGEILPFTGAYSMTALQYHYGISAAFHEYNQSPVRRFNLQLDQSDDLFTPAITTTRMRDFCVDHKIVAVIGMVGTASIEAAVPVAIEYHTPVFAIYGGSALRKPFQKYLINFRASYFDESAAVVELLISRSKKRIAAFIQNDAFGESALAGVRAALSSHSLYLHSKTVHTRNANHSLLEVEVDTAITMMKQVGAAPDAIMVIATYDPAAFFIYRVRQIWPDVVIGGVSATSISVVLDLLAQNTSDATMFENLFFAQVVPLPTNIAYPVISKYTQALSAIGVHEVSFASLESYIMTRLAILALGRIDDNNYTREALLDAIYNTSYFNMNGFRCGPLFPEEHDGGCNQCMHQVLLTVSTADRSIVPVDESNPFFQFSTCGYQPKQWQVLLFGQSCSFSGSQSRHCSDFRDGLRAAFKKVNDAGGIRGTTKLVLDTSDDGGNKATASSNNEYYWRNSSYFGLIGTSGIGVDAMTNDTLQKSNMIMVGPLTGSTSIRSPFMRNILNLRASVADEMFSIVRYCLYHKSIRKVAALYEATTFGHESRNQLESALGEKRLSILSEAGFNRSNVSASVHQMFSNHGSDLEAVVFIGLGDEFGEAAMAIHSARSSVLIFGISLTVTTSLSDPQVQQGVDLNNIFVTQCVPDVTDTNITAGFEYQTALRSIDERLVPSPFGLEGFLVGQLVATSLGRILGQELTVNNLLDAIYENGNFDLFGLRCGPLEETPSTSSKPSCNQCMKSVYMTSFANSSQQVVSTFSFDGECMYTPHTNIDFQLGGSGLVMVVVTACGIVYTLIIMLLLFVCRNSPQVRVTSYRFSLVSCAGAIIIFGGIFVAYPVPTDVTCGLRVWMSDVGFVTLFGPIFAKTYRIDKLFNNPKKMSRKVITDRQVFQIVFALLGCMGLFLTAFMVVDPPHMDEAFTTLGERYEVCANKFKSFLYVDHGAKALMLLWGCFLCQRVYKISGKFATFNESKQLVICIYHTTFLAACALLVTVTTQENPNLLFLCVAALVVMNTLVVVTLLYGRRVYLAIENCPIEDEGDSSTKLHDTSSHVSNNNDKPEKQEMLQAGTKIAVMMRSKSVVPMSAPSFFKKTKSKPASVGGHG